MAEIILYGIIGEPADGCDAATVCAKIRASKGPLSLRINSPGGMVMEGLAIVAAMRAYPSKITAYVDGLAASMGSVIALAAEETVFAESSLFMVHNPWLVSMGDAEELRRDAAQLDRLRDQIIGIYSKRTGLDYSDLRSMMDAETWFNAEQALDAGFATSIAADLQIAAIADFSAFGFLHPPSREAPTMPEPTDPVALERNRISTIMALCDKHGLPVAFKNDLVSKGIALDAAREQILDRLADRDDARGIGHANPSGHVTLDNPETYGTAIRDALAGKITGTATEGPAAQFRSMSVVDIARDVLARNGERDVHRIGAERVINMVMSTGRPGRRLPGDARNAITIGTGDFPDLLGGAAEKVLEDRFRLLQSPLKQLARRRDLPDFLQHYGIQVDDWGALDQVDEHAEYKQRSLNVRKNSYSIKTFGNIFAVSRQMLVSDSLGALASILDIMAAGAAENEALAIASLINSNANYSDGIAFFDAAHGNLAGAGAVPSVDSLDAGRLAMRSQKTSEGRIIDAAPRFILTGVALQTKTEVLVSSTTSPTTTADVNPFANKLTPIADPRLTNPTAWHLFADPTLNPALQYSYLDGKEGPETFQQDAWRVDGTEYKVRHDFGAGWVDYRFGYKNPG